MNNNKNNKPNPKPKPVKIKNDGYRIKNKSVKKYNTYAKEPVNAAASTNIGSDSAEQPVNEYYNDIAYKIKWAKWISAALLILFIFGGMVFNSKELTADNFNYLLRYIDIQGVNTPAVKSEFDVELDEASYICYYKNNIVVLRKNRLDIYDTAGRRNFTQQLVYSNPVMRTSERYILTYDLGMSKLEIFNSFSRVFEYKSDKPIYNAQITDKGSVVYVTTEKGYKSAVYVLNSGFEIRQKYFYGKDYIVCADIDDKAGRLAVAGFYTQDGDYLSRVILYETKSEEPLKNIEIAGEQPYGVKINGSGVFAIFENSLRFYDLKGNDISRYDFAYRKIQKMSLTSEYAAVVLNEKTLGTDDRVLIFDSNGDILYDSIISAEIMDIEFSQDYKYLYFLARTGLYKIDIEKQIFELVSDEYDDTTDNIIYANEKNIFLSGLLKINAVDVE